ncbi:MAG TPA: Hpt domain-containing protein [Caulobacteraceae bacterium]|jgi:HPt (histidine-containing phosphotransfer) domain-containing protein
MARRDITGAVDFAYLEAYAAHDQGVVEEVLNLFCEQAALWRRLLDPHAASEGWRDAAHTLKGSARSIGAGALAEVCEAVELSGDDGMRTARLSQVGDALDVALADIAAYLHEQALRSLKGPAG